MRKPSDEHAPLVRVDGYGETGFTISGTRWQGPLILRVTEVAVWAPTLPHRLGEEAARVLIEGFANPGIILVGTGRARVIPDVRFLALLRSQGFEPEFMSTGAACRTWNVLTMEGRDVVAGLLPAGWHAAAEAPGAGK